MARAEYITLHLKQREHLPDEIAQLINYQSSETISAEANGHQVDTMNLETVETEDIIECRRQSVEYQDCDELTISDDAVVELRENSESIFLSYWVVAQKVSIKLNPLSIIYVNIILKDWHVKIIISRYKPNTSILYKDLVYFIYNY